MNDQDRTTASGGPVCSCKVGRAAAQYGLDRLDQRLLDRRDDGASLRRLETVVNEAILAASLRDADADVIGTPSSIYETLTDDDASAGQRTELEGRLSQAGVDVDALHSDFVSYQTVRTHLRECLDVETNRQSQLSLADAQRTIEWARSRSEGIVERTIERLDGAEGFHAGDVDVNHVVRVSCPDCGASHPIEAFLDRGGCHCSPSD